MKNPFVTSEYKANIVMEMHGDEGEVLHFLNGYVKERPGSL